jgi:hypothetical protein
MKIKIYVLPTKELGLFYQLVCIVVKRCLSYVSENKADRNMLGSERDEVSELSTTSQKELIS